ncbi:cytochrome c oxidase assembly protein COX20, mitochondrial-like [Ptychodera flava]|uniref:cytochrome c oxidase assembly protein COX20, mitochondrial-like n=1 Tax=Ptychodera flava TaxID=63121 RepID=UPI00396A162C
MEETDIDGRNEEAFFLFRTPCTRTAFLTGIGGGFTLGLAHFMFSSRVKRSTDLAVYSFAAITLGTWMYCRYDRAKKRLAQKRVKDAVRQEIRLEKVHQTMSSSPETTDAKLDST